MVDAIAVGQNRQIYNSSLNKRYCVTITEDNIELINRYGEQVKKDDDWRFGDECAENMESLGEDSYSYATIEIEEDENQLKLKVIDVANEEMATGGRRSRTVKKSKPSKKRPTARRRRSSKRKARKARKARATRRR